MYLGHVLAPTLGISKLTWQNSHYRKQNIFVDMFWHFFDIFLTGYITFLTCFDTFLTVLTFFDRQTDRWTEGQTSLSYMTCFDTFWHVLTLFWQFLTFFDIFLTDQPTEPSTRSSGSELKNCDANWINVKLSLDHLKVTQEFAGDNVATWL